MATPNFGSVLDRAPTTVERPKTFPIGTFVWLVKGLPRFDKSAKKGTEFVEFTLQCQSAQEVDEESLEAFLTKPDGSKSKLSEKTMKVTYYLPENSLFRLKDFLKHCGFDVDDEGSTLRQMINETPGCSIVATIKHTPSNDGEAMYANIDRTAAVED